MRQTQQRNPSLSSLPKQLGDVADPVQAQSPGHQAYVQQVQREASGPFPAALSVETLTASPGERGPSPSDQAFGGAVQRKASSGGGTASSAQSSLARAAEEKGGAVDGTVQRKVEQSTGADLSGVRVHTGAASAQAASSIAARAYTTGQDIHFASGQYQPSTAEGQHLIAHELAHTVQQQGQPATRQHKLEVSQPGDGAEREADSVADAALAGRASARPTQTAAGIHRAPEAAETKQKEVKRPQDFATYEEWIAAFSKLGTFTSRDTTENGNNPAGFSVLGDGAANKVKPPAEMRNKQEGEQYIDHPSREWLDKNLPDELRKTAYELPADCADMAVILRHVWLFYHNRTEKVHPTPSTTWTIGVGAGKDEKGRIDSVNNLIRNQVYSGSVAALAAAYKDDGGTKVRSFEKLQPMLHPGDMLVWEHHHNGDNKTRTGGHTQTIQTIQRSGESVNAITCLQGNQPIFQGQKDDIHAAGSKATDDQLGNLPGRRIERSVLSGGELGDMGGVWTWDDGVNAKGQQLSTALVAAGPPDGVTRPPATKHKGEKKATRHITDWNTALKSATSETIRDFFEAALYEARAGIEGGMEAVTEDEARAVGKTAGDRLTTLKSKEKDKKKLDPIIQDMLGETQSFIDLAAGTPKAEDLQKLFRALLASFKGSAPTVAGSSDVELQGNDK